MRNLLFVLAILAVGCGQRSPYDVTPEQVAKRKTRVVYGSIDPNHLQPGAKKEVKVYHKGDVLPDGTISPGERKVMKITVEGPAPGSGAEDVKVEASGAR